MDSVTKLSNLLSAYTQRQCLLFLGAGFSVGAKRTDEHGALIDIPQGRELAAVMADALGETSTDLSDLAGLYEEQFGQHGLYALLNSLFVASDFSSVQQEIASFRWKEVYTTNYDNVFELCQASSGNRYSTYSPSMRVSDVDYRTLPIIHINGLVEGSNFNNFREEIKLSDVQYVSDDFSRSSWGEKFRTDLLTSPCVIFAGYSMYDIDVARIVHEYEGMRDRIFFITKDAPSRSLQRKLEQFGTVVPIGTDGLATIISSIDVQSASAHSQVPTAWERVVLPAAPSKPLRDIDVVNFLMSGSVEEQVFAHDVISKAGNLSIERTASDQIVDLMESGRLNRVLVNANIGNGKSTLMDAVAAKLAARNFNVFRAVSSPSLLLKEIPLLTAISGKVLLVIDDAFANLDVIRALVGLGRDDLYIIGGARTSQFELQEGQIRSVYGDDLEVFDLNSLDSAEVTALILFLDKYALWGERQSLSPELKARFIKVDCAGELRFVILEILDSPNIKSRIQSIINFDGGAEAQDQLKSVLVLSQLLSLAQIRTDVALISELTETDARKALTAHAQRIRDFSLIRNGQLTIKSPIFAEYVLKKLIDTAFVIDLLTRCMRVLDVIHDNGERYKALFQNFSRFRFVETAISSEKRLTHMIGYYENIKVLKNAREHPLFWLQYAMGRLSLNQYREADRLFEVSFSYSKKLGYKENRHQNNQYARFLLESRTNSNEYTDYMAAFNQAHGICYKQIVDDPASHNPYRVAQNYKAFLERRISQLQNGDLISIIRSCAEITNGADKNRNGVRNWRAVEDSLRSIRETADICRLKLRESGYSM